MEVGPITRALTIETELRATKQLLGETRRLCREVVEQRSQMAEELRAAHREAAKERVLNHGIYAALRDEIAYLRSPANTKREGKAEIADRLEAILVTAPAIADFNLKEAA